MYHFKFSTGLRIALLALLLFWAGISCAGNLTLSSSEQAWLKDHPRIRIGIDAGYAPYSFVDQQGQLQGVVADFLPVIERLLGIRFEIVSNLSWTQLMQALREHRLDAVATVVRLPERESFIEFSDIYLPTPLVITTRKETPPLRSVSQLPNLRLTLVEGYSSSKQLLQQFPQLKPHYVSSPLQGLQAVATGKADAYVGVLGVNSFLATKNGIFNLKVNAAFDMDTNGQRFGVRKDWPQFAGLLNKALAAIPAGQKLAIFQRWMPQQADQINRLSSPGYLALVLPWLFPALGIVLLGIVVILLWNRQLQKQLEQRSANLRHALAEVKQREAVLESVFESLPDLFFLMEQDGTVLEYRARRSDDLYVPPESFLGKRMQDVVPPDVAEAFETNLARVRKTDQMQHYEYKLTINGESRQFESRLTRLANSDQYVAVIRDITEQSLDRQRLTESKTRLTEAQRLAHIGSWELDLLTDELQWSEEVFRIFEIDPDKFAASYQAFLDSIHPDDRERVNQAYSDSVAQQHPYVITHRLLLGDNRIKYVEERGETLYDEQGNPLRSRGTVQDITAAVEQNQALESVHSMLEALVQGSSDVIFVKDQAGQYQVANQALAQLLDRKIEDIIGSDDLSLFPQHMAERFRADDQRIMQQKQTESYEEEFASSLGTRQFLTTKGPLVIGGEVQGVFAIARDITDMKAAQQVIRTNEARYRELMEKMTDGFVSLNRDWQYVYLNPRAAEMLGSTRESLISKNIWDEFPEGVGQPFYHAYHKAFNEQVAVQIEEYYEPWDRWFENRIYPNTDGISIFFQDISVRKRAEIALQQSRDELEMRVKQRTEQLANANKELETFTYSVSHDLKAPLRGIDGYSHLLMEEHADQLDADAQTLLGNVRRGVSQMNQLIEDLLAYSRMERRQLQDQSVDLNNLVQQLLNERQHEISAHDVQLKVDLKGLSVRADPNGLAMVLRNLIDNAIKFSAASQPAMIEIIASTQGQAAMIAIKDNGIGFDMRFHDQIFSIFQRLQRSEDYPGTGVGLAIVHKAVQRMGGRVWADSTPGKGTTFYVELAH